MTVTVLWDNAMAPESRAWYEWHSQRGLNPHRVPLSPALRKAVIKRDGHTCQLCGSEITDPTDIHIDHIKPRHKGGKDTLENLQVAHSKCNIQKGATYGED